MDIAVALPAHLVRFERFPGCGHGVLPDATERAMAVIRDFIVHPGRERTTVKRKQFTVHDTGATPPTSPAIPFPVDLVVQTNSVGGPKGIRP
jgi:hypothetical protein